MIAHMKLWNGNKALTLAVLVFLTFLALKVYEAKDEVTYRNDNNINGIRAERRAQMDSLRTFVANEAISNQVEHEAINAKLDSILKELRDK